MDGATPLLTAAMLEPLTDAVATNLPVILPVAMGIMGLLIAVKLIPKIIYKFF